MATVPNNIGQPTSAAVGTGSVNRRGEYIDWRAAKSPERPKLNTARRYSTAAVSGSTIVPMKRPTPASEVSAQSMPSTPVITMKST